VAYVIIGLCALLVVSSVCFLVALTIYEKLSDWRVQRRAMPRRSRDLR
jgi:hypothetical protein